MANHTRENCNKNTARPCFRSVFSLFFACLFAFPGSLLSAGEIYKSVDAQGRVTYSDRKSNDKAEPVNLPTVNTQPALKTRSTSNKSNQTAVPNYTVEILSPASGTTFHADQRTINVQFSVNPKFGSNLTVQAILDGAPYGGEFHDIELNLSGLDRGEHSLNIILRNENGEILTQSQTIVLYVKRPSVNMPVRKNS